MNRINKIARLMNLSKLATLDSSDPTLQGWLDFYRRIRDLDTCARKEEINFLTKEQAFHFLSIITDIERMGGTLPEDLKSDVSLKGLLGRQVLCDKQILLNMTIPFDVIGSFDALGPIATIADLVSAGISFGAGDPLSGILSVIATIPNSDIVIKPLKIAIHAIRIFNKGTTTVKIGGATLDREDIKPAAKFALTNLKANEDKFLSLLSGSTKASYDNIISDLQRYAS